MIPITFQPHEKLQIEVLFRSNRIIEIEDMIDIKAITGKICTNKYRIPYHIKISKCPLHFSSLRIDFPVL